MFSRLVMFRSIRSRIVIFFTALLVLVQAVSLILVYAANTRNARTEVSKGLNLGERVFTRILDQNSQKLVQAATVLSLDFAFREAVATRDLETVKSALANHGARIRADLMALVSLERQIIADTSISAQTGKPFPFGWLIDEAERSGEATELVMMDGHAYQLTIVPVLAPTPIAWAAFAFVVDNRLAGELKNLSALEVSFLANEVGKPWQVLASTISAPLQDSLRQKLPAAFSGSVRQESALTMADGEYETLLLPLQRTGNSAIVAVLQRSLDDTLYPYRELNKMLVLLAIGSTLLSIGGGILIARGVTRPISMLTEVTKRMEEGDYTHAVSVVGTDEIGELASRFNLMREGIAEREEQISKLAFRDALTDLPNRAVFNDRLLVAVEVAKRSETPLTVLFLDMDRFKNINDTLGHPIGDQVLQQVARRLSNLLRGADTTARLGGDEFAILLIDADIDAARGVAEKIESALEEPITVGQHRLDVHASIGAASCPEHGDTADTLMRHADAAMYAAKRSNTVFAAYDPLVHQHPAEQLSLLSDLRHAIDHEELRLVYQPKIGLKTGKVTGAEALVRWHHPERGLILPHHFIPFAEETGFITSITRWIIEAAVQQAADWRVGGHPIKVSVNLSVHDLLNPELLNVIAGSLGSRDLPANLICVEITESAVMQNAERSIEILKQIHDLGVACSIDDFGTGYSSLAYLKHLTADEIKIDRSFIHNVINDSKDKAIVLSIVELGHNLGLSVVAEGIENERTMEVLRDLGCDEAQGYFFEKPLESSALMDWIGKYSERADYRGGR